MRRGTQITRPPTSPTHRSELSRHLGCFECAEVRTTKVLPDGLPPAESAARQALAKDFGASDIVEERGDDAVATVLRLTDGAGVDAALECVGTDQSIATCAGIVRAGGMIGAVSVPLYEEFQYKTLFWKNIGIKGGVAPARQYIPELLDDVLAGRINPGLVFDDTTDLDHVADAHAAIDQRRAIKTSSPSPAIALPRRANTDERSQQARSSTVR